MSYYTGPIFEIGVEGYPGSIAGGGRYDEMVEKYVNVEVPACGFSIGFERLINILMEMNYTIPNNKQKYAILLDKDSNIDEIKDNIVLANKLRNENKEVNVLYKSKNYKFQKETLENNGYEIINNRNDKN